MELVAFHSSLFSSSLRLERIIMYLARLVDVSVVPYVRFSAWVGIMATGKYVKLSLKSQSSEKSWTV